MLSAMSKKSSLPSQRQHPIVYAFSSGQHTKSDIVTAISNYPRICCRQQSSPPAQQKLQLSSPSVANNNQDCHHSDSSICPSSMISNYLAINPVSIVAAINSANQRQVQHHTHQQTWLATLIPASSVVAPRNLSKHPLSKPTCQPNNMHSQLPSPIDGPSVLPLA